MADFDNAFYDIGTISVGSGSTVVTGVGTNWLAASLRKGDVLNAGNARQRISSIDGNGAITLMAGWPGTANLTGVGYWIERTPDAARVIEGARRMVSAIESGGLAAMADLVGAANKMPYYTGPSTMATTDITEMARSLLASALLSVSGNNLVTSGSARITGGAVSQTTTDKTAGRLLKTRDFGLGEFINLPTPGIAASALGGGFYSYNSGGTTSDGPDGSNSYYHSVIATKNSDPQGRYGYLDFRLGQVGAPTVWVGNSYQSGSPVWAMLRTSANTTVDSNGFLKAASPIVRLFNDKIEEPVQPTGAVMTRIGEGHYELAGTLGLAQEGWQIEVPRCPNGNRLVFVDTAYDGVLTIKTSVPVFENGLWVAGAPIDVPEGRWIDVRLHEVPIEPEEVPEHIAEEDSNDPVD